MDPFSADADARRFVKEERRMGGSSRALVWLVLICCFLFFPELRLRADGGTVRLRQQAGAYHVTVFTAPTPFRAGLVDVSVLVLDAATGEFVPEARVSVRLTARASGEVLEYPATAAAATNKLFHAAVFQLPEPGWWDLDVGVEGPRGPALLRFGIEADEPPPRWLELWPWFAWPALAVVFFGLHQRLVRRKISLPSRRGRQAATSGSIIGLCSRRELG
jgi:hypothetical protein